MVVSYDERFINNIANQIIIIKDYKAYLENGNLATVSKENQYKESNKISSSEKMVLELQLTNILSRFGSSKEDKEKLEEEYQKTLNALKRLKNHEE